MKMGFDIDINCWMNFRCRENGEGVPVVLFEDHRGVVPVAKLAEEYEIFKSPPILLRLDRHADFGCTPLEGLSAMSASESYGKANSHLSGCDGTWVFPLAQAGLVKASGTWYVEKDSVHQGLYKGLNEVETHAGSCPVWFAGTFSEFASDYQQDRAYSKEMRVHCEINNDLRWRFVGEELWLDIDLDFCTTGQGILWTKNQFDQEFAEGSGAYDLVLDLVSRAKLITICTEPTFTGGLKNSLLVLDWLNERFPDTGSFSGW